MEIKAPDLDDRTSETVFKQTIELAKHYCPEWAGEWLKDPDKKQINDDPGLVMFRLFSMMTEHLIKQMNRIPEKHRIDFLDFMGIDLLPAKPSRVPLTFYLVKKASGDRIPQGTIVAARPTKEMTASKVPEIVFETEKDLDVVPVRMSAVYSLNPWRDKYTDHSKAASGKDDGFLIFGRDADEIPLDHILYLGDNALFDIRKEAALTIKLYGENLISTKYFSIWFEGKDDGKKIPLEHEFEPKENAIQAKFSKFKPISRSLIDKEESFWISVKPKSGIEIQNPFNWDEIPTGERKRFLDFISWNFGEEWQNASIEKNPNDELFISVETPSETKVISLLRTLSDDKRELNFNSLKYIFPLKTVAGKRYLYHQPIISRIIADISSITADVSVDGILPDMAFYNDTPVDVKKGFFPFGEMPKVLDTFYLASEEAFSKKDSTITLDIKIKKGTGTVTPELSWEYWNGKQWSKISTGFNGSAYKFERDGLISFTCPEIESIEFNGQMNRWIRVRIIQGNYGDTSKFVQDAVDDIINPLTLDAACVKDDIIKKLNQNGITFGFHMTESTLDPPFIPSLLIKYKYTNKEIQRIKSYNNFQFKDIKNAENFEPYEPSTEKLPALYLGFEKDENLRGKPVSIFFAVKEKLYNRKCVLVII